MCLFCSVPKAEVLAAKAEVLELSDKVYEAKTGVNAFRVATRPLTPRPQWGGEMPGMDKPYGVSTAQQVERICKENAFLAVNISRFQLNFAASEATLAEVKPDLYEEKSNTNNIMCIFFVTHCNVCWMMDGIVMSGKSEMYSLLSSFLLLFTMCA